MTKFCQVCKKLRKILLGATDALPFNLKLRSSPQDSPGPVSMPRAQRSMQEQDQDERVHERLGDEIDHASEPLRLREDEEGEAAVKLNIGG